MGGFSAAGDSVSDEVSSGVSKDCCARFCLRASRLFNPARRLIASLLMYSVAGMDSRSATGLAGIADIPVGLATCARVGALDIVMIKTLGAFGTGRAGAEPSKVRKTLLILSALYLSMTNCCFY